MPNKITVATTKRGRACLLGWVNTMDDDDMKQNIEQVNLWTVVVMRVMSQCLVLRKNDFNNNDHFLSIVMACLHWLHNVWFHMSRTTFNFGENPKKNKTIIDNRNEDIRVGIYSHILLHDSPPTPITRVMPLSIRWAGTGHLLAPD